MRILVANLGSTSFKYKLLDMEQDGAEGTLRPWLAAHLFGLHDLSVG